MNTPSRTPGISRIDQPAKHNHGFFVRIQRGRKMHSAFFSDKAHGSRAKALAAAQQHYQKLLARLGPPKQRRMPRRWWAEIRRRKGSSGIVGVQKQIIWCDGKVRKYWRATWSPEPYVVARESFSVRKYGFRRARRLAIRARRAGLRSMQPAASGSESRPPGAGRQRGGRKGILQINLEREFFGLIAAGTLRIEYRDRTPYWKKRLEGRHYDVIRFCNGCTRQAPEMLVEFRGLRRYGKGRNAYYAIRLGRILQIQRWKP